MAGGDAVVRSRVKESAKRRLRNRLDTLVPRGDPCVYGLHGQRVRTQWSIAHACAVHVQLHIVRSYQFVLGAGERTGPIWLIQRLMGTVKR